ncbi:SPOR domain-containing protein [Legionella pneumophila serogroup 1]
MIDGKEPLDEGVANQPRTLFKPGAWLAKVDFINHLILFNNVLITILSEKEGGKTCFNSLLKSHLNQQIKSVSFKAEPPFDSQDIINEFARQLHLNNKDNNIGSLAAQINERKTHVLLIIDDAHHLPESFIKEVMIIIKNQEDFGFFHLCLISDYSIVATLNNLAVEPFNNLIHTIELGALSETETRTYVLQRAMASHLINRPLSDAQFKQFYHLTKGNLSKINSNLELFLSKCANEKQNNKKAILKRISLVASFAIVAGLSYFYFDNVYKAPDNTPKLPDLASVATLPPINDLIKTPTQQAVPKQESVSYIASWEDSSTRQLVHYGLPKKQILEDFMDEEDTLNTVAIVDKVVVIPKLKAKNISEQVGQAVVSQSKLPPIPHSPQTKLASEQPGIKKINSKLFTIQLAASHKVEDINRFKNQNKWLAQAKIRHFTNAKGSWYILTIGEYESRNQALLNIKKLPGELAKLSPWIRSVEGLSNIG